MLLRGPASITTSSAVTGGPPATRCRLEILIRIEADAESRRATGLDRLAVLGHELGVAPDLTLGGLDTGHAADRGQQRLGQLSALQQRSCQDLGLDADRG